MSLGRRSLLALVATGAALAMAPAALAAPHLTWHGWSQSYAMSDGERYAAFQVAPGVSRVFDTADRRRARVFTVDVRSRCGEPRPAWSPGTELDDVGAGTLLWHCAGARGHTLLTDLQSGVSEDLPALDRETYGASGRAYAVGRRWIAVLESPGGKPSTSYLNRETGERHPGYNPDPDDQPLAVADLDAPQLVEPLCSPLRRQPKPEDPYASYRSMQLEAPWGLEERGLGPRYGPGGFLDGYERYALVLRRCGRRRGTVLQRCAVDDCSGFLGSARVSWTTRRFARVMSAASGRRYSWSREQFGLRKAPPEVTHTANRVFFTKTVRTPQGYRRRIASARTPR